MQCSKQLEQVCGQLILDKVKLLHGVHMLITHMSCLLTDFGQCNWLDFGMAEIPMNLMVWDHWLRCNGLESHVIFPALPGTQELGSG